MYTAFDIFQFISVTIVTALIVRRSIYVLYYHIIAPFLLKPKVNVKSLGKWALITGSTDGIGFAFAEYFASLGINLILISRNKDKLKNTATIFKEKYNIETKIIQADFTRTDIYEDIEKQIFGYEIGILINNVGMTHEYPALFLSVPDKEVIYDKIITCNILPVTKLCMIILPSMLERKRGLIINVASIASVQSSPMLTVYSATKSYVRTLTSNLNVEYGNKGVTIQCLTTGAVLTNMTKSCMNNSQKRLIPNSQQYVRQAMKYVGLLEETTGHISHSLVSTIFNFINFLSVRVYHYLILSLLQSSQKRALKK